MKESLGCLLLLVLFLSISKGRETKLLVDLQEHGITAPRYTQNPDYIVTFNQYEESPGELTEKGIFQMQKHGKELRKEYIQDKGFLPNDFKPQNFHLEAYRDEPSTLSTYSSMLGVYPDSINWIQYQHTNGDSGAPFEKQDENKVRKTLGLSPNPSQLTTREATIWSESDGKTFFNDPLSNCPEMQNQISKNLQDAHDKYTKNRRFDALFDKMANTFGVERKEITFKSAHLYLDDFVTSQANEKPVPEFDEQFVTEQIIQNYYRKYYFEGLFGDNLDLARVASTPYFNYLLTAMYAKYKTEKGELTNDHYENLKYAQFTGNENAMIAAIKLLNRKTTDPDISPKFGLTLRFELFEEAGKYFVKTTLDGKTFDLDGSPDGIMSYEDFMNLIYSKLYFGDIGNYCRGFDTLQGNDKPILSSYEEYIWNINPEMRISHQLSRRGKTKFNEQSFVELLKDGTTPGKNDEFDKYYSFIQDRMSPTGQQNLYNKVAPEERKYMLETSSSNSNYEYSQPVNTYSSNSYTQAGGNTQYQYSPQQYSQQYSQPVTTTSYASSSQPAGSSTTYVSSSQPAGSSTTYVSSSQPVRTSTSYASSSQPAGSSTTYVSSSQPAGASTTYVSSQPTVVSSNYIASPQPMASSTNYVAVSSQPVQSSSQYVVSQPSDNVEFSNLVETSAVEYNAPPRKSFPTTYDPHVTVETNVDVPFLHPVEVDQVVHDAQVVAVPQTVIQEKIVKVPQPIIQQKIVSVPEKPTEFHHINLNKAPQQSISFAQSEEPKKEGESSLWWWLLPLLLLLCCCLPLLCCLLWYLFCRNRKTTQPKPIRRVERHEIEPKPVPRASNHEKEIEEDIKKELEISRNRRSIREDKPVVVHETRYIERPRLVEEKNIGVYDRTATYDTINRVDRNYQHIDDAHYGQQRPSGRIIERIYEPETVEVVERRSVSRGRPQSTGRRSTYVNEKYKADYVTSPNRLSNMGYVNREVPREVVRQTITRDEDYEREPRAIGTTQEERFARDVIREGEDVYRSSKRNTRQRVSRGREASGGNQLVSREVVSPKASNYDREDRRGYRKAEKDRESPRSFTSNSNLRKDAAGVKRADSSSGRNVQKDLNYKKKRNFDQFDSEEDESL
ncbi:unnamed protein product [Moneuplotes crassus]|uniref:Uncharacterized protein n=1 Tax=Euplotes crassus TaxID=5936 RepID=A0AAD1XN52_EUPCR|nr:unnamed protein product [Moneuplotes crassus]